MKKVLVRIRMYIKFLILVCIATFLIFSAVVFIYKPIYKVSLNGELLGYCAEKSKLQSKIDEFIETGDSQNNNIAFMQIENMPTYSMCLLKRDIVPNDDEILEKIKKQGTAYYKYYAILEDEEEKYYISNFQNAEKIVQTLKEKDSSNIDNIKIIEKYSEELKEFSEIDTAVAGLYKEKIVQPVKVATKKSTTKSSSNSSGFSTSTNISKSQVSIGVSFIKPITGTITSRFGAKSRIRSSAHTGLDIAAGTGTPIKAAASGTVTFSGTKGSYGKLVVITHSNGTQTYYGHCSSLYVSEGQTVAQGETIAAVGSTGNSTRTTFTF